MTTHEKEREMFTLDQIKVVCCPFLFMRAIQKKIVNRPEWCVGKCGGTYHECERYVNRVQCWKSWDNDEEK